MKPSQLRDRSIAILGGRGQLGRALADCLGSAAVPIGRDRCDITNEDSVRRVVQSESFDWVINTAAYTNVDGAETDAETCYAINHLAVQQVVNACELTRARLIHISTDYVFSGDDRSVPFTETDPTDPQSVYAKSKLLGEQVACQYDRHLVIRTCGIYDASPPNSPVKNFCNTILRLADVRDELNVVDDQWCSPSYAPHISEAIERLIRLDARGIFHVVNEGATTWFQLASRLVELAGLNTVVNPISTAEYRAAAVRPMYSVLDTHRYRSLTGHRMPHWTEAVQAYVQRRNGRLAPVIDA